VKLKDFNALASVKLRFIEPMYPAPVQEVPAGDQWLYEIKLDGHRVLAGKDSRGITTIWSGKGSICTTQFPRIARACERLQPDTLIDGQIVAVDGNGRVSFNLLQHHRSKASAIQFYAFDLLIYRGRSLLKVPLEIRREMLNEALSTVWDPIRLSDSIEAAPADLVVVAKELGFEGIIAKKKDSLYESGKRSGAWVKYKIDRGQE
jgi:bifunctional non-homologous end joining protein LigD